jgi:hypothetical protein
MSNITENRLNATILPADITIINTSITAIAAKLPAGSLTPEQRKSLLSLDVENKVFVEDCINEMAISGTGIVPPFISAANIQNDLSLFEQLDIVEANLENLLQKVSDLKRIAADEAMSASNTVYKAYEMANEAGIANAKQGYDKLKARYARQGQNPPIDNPM